MLVTQTMAFSSTALKETPKLQDTWNRAPTKKRQVTALSSEPAPHFLPALKPIFFFFFGGKTIRSSPERGFYRPPPRAPARPSGRGRPAQQRAPRGLGRGHSAQLAHLRLPAGDPAGAPVAPGVLGQVVAAHEPPLAHGAHELLLPSVSSAVAREFI